mmetsp:Transcript_25125/g.28737  ORF Transcript_25125/g.28737 Transcript_25125/m.28737 type:complete len:561 (+) Transcript_25125:93-1775(+)
MKQHVTKTDNNTGKHSVFSFSSRPCLTFSLVLLLLVTLELCLVSKVTESTGMMNITTFLRTTPEQTIKEDDTIEGQQKESEMTNKTFSLQTKNIQGEQSLSSAGQEIRNINEEEKEENNDANKAEEQQYLHPLYIVPKEPDLSIGQWLHSVIHNEKNKNEESVDEYNPLLTCSPTSQIQISVSVNDDPDSKWIIESVDEDGKKKSIGGDEFFVTYTDQNNNRKNNMATAVAVVKDNLDGTYELDFLSTGMGNPIPLANITGNGSLEIKMLFTCGIGRMTRPTKDSWTNGGHLYDQKYTYNIANVTAPPIRQVSRPNVSSNGTQIIDFSIHDHIFCFGDSLMQNFCGHFFDTYLFKQKNIQAIGGNSGQLVMRDTLNETLIKLEDNFTEALNEISEMSHHDKNATDEVQPRSTAIIVGSAAWELGSNIGSLENHNFNSSIEMYYDLIRGIRSRFPEVTIYWKSPEAVHPSVLGDKCYRNVDCIDRTRYVSTSSMKYLYEQQKRIMKELDVPFLDLWEVTYVSISWHMHRDCIHYRHWMNIFLLDCFYPDSMQLNPTDFNRL